jgi:hypothetical protein
VLPVGENGVIPVALEEAHPGEEEGGAAGALQEAADATSAAARRGDVEELGVHRLGHRQIVGTGPLPSLDAPGEVGLDRARDRQEHSCRLWPVAHPQRS